MKATNKRRENLTWPDEDETRKQLEAIRELAKELRTDYPTDTPQIWGCVRNQQLNRRNAYIRAQFSTDETAWHLINGSEWLELFDLLGFSVDKETRKRFASHLNWYSFWYANFKPRLSSKYAQRIHWYVCNFLFCLRNKLQTEKDYREGKYGSKGQAYFMKIEQQPSTPTETPRISTETEDTANVSVEGEKEAETQENSRSDTRIVSDGYGNQYEVTRHWENGRVESLDVIVLDTQPQTATEPPQSPETPQTAECTADTPKPRETARKPLNRGIGNTWHSRLGANGYAMLDNASATLTAMCVPRECSTADAAYWEPRQNSLLVTSNEFQSKKNFSSSQIISLNNFVISQNNINFALPNN